MRHDAMVVRTSLIFGSTVSAMSATISTNMSPPPIHHGVNTIAMLKNMRIRSMHDTN